jgi:hypothetical protein
LCVSYYLNAECAKECTQRTAESIHKHLNFLLCVTLASQRFAVKKASYASKAILKRNSLGRYKIEDDGIHAIALSCWLGTIIKYVTEVRITAPT